jgi:hypothetical protein
MKRCQLCQLWVQDDTDVCEFCEQPFVPVAAAPLVPPAPSGILTSITKDEAGVVMTPEILRQLAKVHSPSLPYLARVGPRSSSTPCYDESRDRVACERYLVLNPKSNPNLRPS